MGSSPASDDLAAQTAQSSLYTVSASGVTLVSGLARSILMTRLLLPQEVGVAMLAVTLLYLAVPLRDFGLDQALIHRKASSEEALEEALATHFTLRLILSTLFILLLLLAVPLLRTFYPEQSLLVPILLALAVGDTIDALADTPKTFLKKEMRFKELSLLAIITSITMTIVGPLMAWQGYGAWAIVGERVSGLVVAALVVWFIVRPWRPRLRFDRSLMRWYANFGKYVSASIMLNNVIDQWDDFWVGTMLGSAPLGIYSKATEYADYPRRVISEPITQVLFPAFARAQEAPEQLSKVFFRATSLIVRGIFLMGGIILLVAPEFVPLILGSQWVPMILPLQLMAFYLLLDPLRRVSGDLVVAVGKPQIYTRVRLVQALLTVLFVAVGAFVAGVEGVAVAVNLVLLIGLAMLGWEIGPIVQISFRRLLLVPIVAILVGLLLGWGSASLFQGPLARLVIKTVAFTVGYTVVLLLFERAYYQAHLPYARQLLRGVIPWFKKEDSRQSAPPP